MLSDVESRLANRVPDRWEPLVSADRVGQFITTGAVGVGVEVVVLAALVEFAVAGELVGDIVGKEAAVVVMFALNERWTFADSGSPGLRPLVRRLTVSHLVRALGNSLALAVYAMLFLWVGVWYIAAALVGIAAGFAVNYLCEGLYTWRLHATAG